MPILDLARTRGSISTADVAEACGCSWGSAYDSIRRLRVKGLLQTARRGRYELTSDGYDYEGSLPDRVVRLVERLGSARAADVEAELGVKRLYANRLLGDLWDAQRLDRAERGVYVPPGTAEAAQ